MPLSSGLSILPVRLRVRLNKCWMCNQIYSEIDWNLLWSLSVLSVEVQGFSQLWLLRCRKGERVVCTYSNLSVIRLAVKGKLLCFVLFFYSYNSSILYITFIFSEKEKVMNYTAIQMIAWIYMTYLVILLCTKMLCSEGKPGTVNTALTMLGSHQPSSPFSEQSFCASSISLLMLPNRWLQ